MKSKLIEEKRRGMVEICKSMTPEERLKAFANHSQQMVQIHLAGEAFRASSNEPINNEDSKKL